MDPEVNKGLGFVVSDNGHYRCHACSAECYHGEAIEHRKGCAAKSHIANVMSLARSHLRICGCDRVDGERMLNLSKCKACRISMGILERIKQKTNQQPEREE
jgi:hypothetical protein